MVGTFERKASYVAWHRKQAALLMEQNNWFAHLLSY